MKLDNRRILSKEDLGLWEEVKKTFDKTLSPINSKKNHNSYKNQKPFFKDRKLLENVTVDKEEVIITGSKFVGPTSSNGVRVGYNLDKKILNLLKKGKMEPEKTLDLHGLNTKQAEKRVLEFLQACHLQGARLVLIITGKGRSSEEPNNPCYYENRTGILRKSLTSWIENSKMHPAILDILPANSKHGGDGAFYIYLRKAK